MSLSSRSFSSPGIEDLDDGRVVSEAAVDFRFGEDVFVSGTGIHVADGFKLFVGQSDKFFLVFFGDAVEFLDCFVDGCQDVGEDRVIFVVHFALSDSFESEGEHVGIDFGFVFFVGNVDGLEGFFHDGGDDFGLVIVFDGFDFLEDVFRSGIDVVFECDLLIDEVLHRKKSTVRRQLFLMLR